MCGEQSPCTAARALACGSSPRVRGTGCRHTQDRHRARFIPACAGNSPVAPRPRRHTPVHPRVCGEQVTSRHLASLRFIPACAGNRSSMMMSGSVSSVHPRVCGEQYAKSGSVTARFGSSPRVRGTELQVHIPDPSGRFIPACAGNRRPSSPVPSAHPVNPRVCGEQGCGLGLGLARFGSSPRVRGTAQRMAEQAVGPRFIPACAGNRKRTDRPDASAAVHPRVCGEQGCRCSYWCNGSGSSPRVRGTGYSQRRLQDNHRFIPACAGNRS